MAGVAVAVRSLAGSDPLFGPSLLEIREGREVEKVAAVGTNPCAILGGELTGKI